LGIFSRFFSFAWLSVLCLPALAAETQLQGRVDPHFYGGDRKSVPNSQVNFQVFSHWGSSSTSSSSWNLVLHAEFETLGIRDRSIDLDRAWIQTLPKTSPFSLIVGRIHPWDVSENPLGRDPFSASATQHAQNRGVLLGYGWDRGKPTPSPILMGWLGVHLWSDPSGNAPWAFGFSASPLFVPTLGSEVSISENGPQQVGRFGRRPPGRALINGAEVPIRYSIANYRLLEDVLLHPQFLFQSRLQTSEDSSLRWKGWLTLSRAPSPDPVIQSQGFLKVTDENLSVLALVEPSFPQQWMADFSQVLILGRELDAPKIVGSIYAKENGSKGLELGLQKYLTKFSVMNNQWSGSSEDYGAWLIRLDSEFHLPFLNLKLYGGWYQHWLKKDSWMRAAISVPLSQSAQLNLGTDIFSGDPSTYFGEWRTNDRLFAVLQWEIFE